MKSCRNNTNENNDLPHGGASLRVQMPHGGVSLRVQIPHGGASERVQMTYL